MENNLKILASALNGANKAGVFTLQESATIFHSFQELVNFVNSDLVDKEVPELEDKPKSNK